MADLFKKLNVLVKASLNELLGGEHTGSPSSSPRPTLTPDRLGGDIDRQIASMRQRVDDAKAYESKLQSQIDALDKEIKHLDALADAAVARGDDVNARFAIADLRAAEHRQIKLMNDLRDHQVAAQELIDRIDQMAAMVEQAREQAQANPPAAAQPAASRPLPSLADVLRRAQEAAGEPNQTAGSHSEPPAVSSSPAENPIRSSNESPILTPASEPVEDDLERRRQRLSKKD